MSNGPITGETAPSHLRGDEPTFARTAGGVGWGLICMGAAILAANQYFQWTWLPSEGRGWLITLVGTMLALIHAAVETDLLLRRLLGGLGVGFIALGAIAGAIAGYKGKSWAMGIIPALPGVLLLALYVRRKDDEAIRGPALLALGATGLALAALGVLGTIIKPEWMPARFSVMMALGFLLTLLYVGIAGMTDDIAYRVAQVLGLIGGMAFGWAVLRSALPSVFYDWRGPPDSEHLIAVAAGLSLVLLGAVAIVLLGKPPEGGADTDSQRNMRRWGRIGVAAGIFLLLLGVLRYAAPTILSNTGWLADPPRPYLVPTGFVLMGIGLVYLLTSVGFVSENRLVVLTRREFTAFFVSPIAYCVMVGFVLIATPSYYIFLEGILLRAEVNQPAEEPIVQNYVIAFLPVVAVMLAVPLLTMRLFAEEKRTGTLEVLLTAPVNDWLIVLSKWLASWMFFMLLWAPWWLYLLAMRLEGGQEFDFRPMIGFSVALLACGAAFTAMGMFFSSLTRDQIISAALTLMGMMILVGFFFVERNLRGTGSLQVTTKAVMRALSFIHMWLEATEGKLFLRDIIVQLSAAVFWLFATVKVLEARRWS